MTQDNKPLNSHIEEYLDYYCGLSHSPEFAVLLKGQWGAGKTWFINNYCEKLKAKNQQCLYVSLYGMTSFSEIEEAFFQELHPILSSKGMAIAGKICKGFLRGALKFDIDNDTKDDGTWNVQIPDFDLPEYLKDADKRILIFDDLERCKIDINNILGYINSFVEHKGLKVIIVAHEDELIKVDDRYKVIKEKLIGKTFSVSLNFEGVLENYITIVKSLDVRSFLVDNAELIESIYSKAEYENLRNLKQIVLDFERIFESLPEKARNKPELLQDILKFLIAFSIEIKRGKIVPKDISGLKKAYITAIQMQAEHNVKHRVNRYNYENNQPFTVATKENSQEENSIQQVLDRYKSLNISLDNPFPSNLWWQTFLDKGILDKQELEQSLLTSEYFQDENTPDWIRLWHFHTLKDDEFDNLLKKVELEYANKEFVELGEIEHIFGLFLKFSDIGLYNKSKEEILNDSKLYIDYFDNNDELDVDVTNEENYVNTLSDGYRGLGFQGREFTEFIEFRSYVDKIRQSAKIKKLPSAGQALLSIMQNDVDKFYQMICINDSPNWDSGNQKYFNTPILKYIKEDEFIKKFIAMEVEKRRIVYWALARRYEYDNNNSNLVEELEWLKSVYSLLLNEASRKKGKLSGYVLEDETKRYLDEAIKKLEEKKNTSINSQ
jgi:GTPase SAR1 family protein